MMKDARYLYNMWELAPLNLTDVAYIEGWIGACPCSALGPRRRGYTAVLLH
jgi:hypothetical protein